MMNQRKRAATAAAATVRSVDPTFRSHPIQAAIVANGVQHPRSTEAARGLAKDECIPGMYVDKPEANADTLLARTLVAADSNMWQGDVPDGVAIRGTFGNLGMPDTIPQYITDFRAASLERVQDLVPGLVVLGQPNVALNLVVLAAIGAVNTLRACRGVLGVGGARGDGPAVDEEIRVALAAAAAGAPAAAAGAVNYNVAFTAASGFVDRI